MPADAPRPCPYCAHERCEVREIFDQDEQAFAVTCDECGCRGPVDAAAVFAVLKWNMRYGHEAPTHMLFDWKH